MTLTPAKTLCCVVALFATTIAATRHHAVRPAVTREVIAVYVGSSGTDAGMTTVVADMRAALGKQAAAEGFRFIARGVSIDPTVEGGIRHLVRLGTFDEITVGGNWGNSAVVRYVGGDSRSQLQLVPQVVLLEREARSDERAIEFGPERELGRFTGIDGISAWVRRGAPVGR
jgi:hypothetical protein